MRMVFADTPQRRKRFINTSIGLRLQILNSLLCRCEWYPIIDNRSVRQNDFIVEFVWKYRRDYMNEQPSSSWANSTWCWVWHSADFVSLYSYLKIPWCFQSKWVFQLKQVFCLRHHSPTPWCLTLWIKYLYQQRLEFDCIVCSITCLQHLLANIPNKNGVDFIIEEKFEWRNLSPALYRL